MYSFSATVALCFTIFTIIIIFVYAFKEHLNKLANRIFSWVLLSNFIGLVLQLISFIFTLSTNNVDNVLYHMVVKLVLTYYLIFELLMILYVYAISNDITQVKNSKYVKFKNILLTISGLAITLLFVLPLNIVQKGNFTYPDGLSVKFIYFLVLIGSIYMVYCLFKNIKNIFNKAYIPLVFYLFFGCIGVLFQFINPSMLLMTPIESLVVILMFFTIENPDLQIVNEYLNSRNIAEKQNRDKTMFLYNMVQKIRNPILEINMECQYAYNDDVLEEVKDCVRNIDIKANGIIRSLNTIYDVEKINESTLRVFNNVYKTKHYFDLFKTYEARVDENIKYNYYVDSDIPETLYGDFYNIKDIIGRVFNNVIKTENIKNIDIKLSNAIKVNVCRLIISINYDGRGYTYEEIGESLENGFFKSILDDLRMINGTMYVNSELDKRTEIVIVMDQLIDNNYIHVHKLDKIETEIKKKRVIYCDDVDAKDIEKVLSSFDFNVEKTSIGMDIVKAVRNYEKYDLVILRYDIEPINAVEICKKLHDVLTFNAPIILITKEVDAKKMDELIKLGITSVIQLPFNKKVLINEINRILNDKNSKKKNN